MNEFEEFPSTIKDRAPLKDMTSQKNNSLPNYFENVWNQGNFIDKTASLKQSIRNHNSQLQSTKGSEVLSRQSKSQILPDEIYERNSAISQTKSSVQQENLTATLQPVSNIKTNPTKPKQTNYFFKLLVVFLLFMFVIWELFYFQLPQKNASPIIFRLFPAIQNNAKMIGFDEAELSLPNCPVDQK